MKHIILTIILILSTCFLIAQKKSDEGNYEAQWVGQMQSEVEDFVLEQFKAAGEAFDQKEYAKALESLETVQRVVPNDPWVMVNVASCLIELQRYEDADVLLKDAQRLEPSATYIYNNRGVMYSKQGKHSLAMAQYQKAVQIDPQNYAVYSNMASAALRDDKLDEASKYISMALKREKQSASLLDNAGTIAMRKENYDAAERYFQKAIKKAPKYYKAYLSLSDVEGRRGNYNEAIKYIDKAMNLEPDRAEPYASRGILYQRQEMYDKSKSDFEKALSIQRNNNFARLYYGRTLSQLGEYAKAVEELEKVVNDDDYRHAAQIELAQAHNNAEEYGPALSTIDAYLQEKSKNPDAWRLKGLILSNMGNEREARIAYTKATGLNSGDAVSYINQAVMYYNKQDFAGVLKVANQAENNKVRDPKLADMKVVSLINLKKEGDVPKAIKEAEKLGVESAKIASYWGQFQMKVKGDFKAAVPYFTEAIKKNPKDGFAFYYRGFCHANLGDMKQAKADATKGKQVGDEQAKAACQNLLDQL